MEMTLLLTSGLEYLGLSLSESSSLKNTRLTTHVRFFYTSNETLKLKKTLVRKTDANAYGR